MPTVATAAPAFNAPRLGYLDVWFDIECLLVLSLDSNRIMDCSRQQCNDRIRHVWLPSGVHLTVTDLRSDSVTKPTLAIRKFLADSKVGDDVFAKVLTGNQL